VDVVRKGLGIAGLLAVLSLAGVSTVCAHDPFIALKMSRLPAGSMAVPFELTSLDGTRVKLSDLAGPPGAAPVKRKCRRSRDCRSSLIPRNLSC